jgi:hypothetical protein
MGSAKIPNLESQLVNVGTTNIVDPTFFIKYEGKLYSNSFVIVPNNSAGTTRRVIYVVTDTSGNVGLLSVGTGYEPDLPAVTLEDIEIYIVST